MAEASVLWPNIRRIDSLAALRVMAFDEKGLIAPASGFIVMHDERYFLITNFHVVSGLDLFSGQMINGRVPKYIKIPIRTNILSDNENIFIDAYPELSDQIKKISDKGFGILPLAQRVEIYGGDPKMPLWYEHPVGGRGYDVIAIPITPGSDWNIELLKYFTLDYFVEDADMLPGGAVSILGYPVGISVRATPIWKAGYVASEPWIDVILGGSLDPQTGDLNGKSIPAFFVDAQTKKGMSGSPVLSCNNVIMANMKIYTQTKLAGIYSGRVGVKEEEATLGLCWRAQILKEVLVGGVLGSHPHCSFID